MVPKQLEPRLELLREEYVLVQAWKKTASYIRYHKWPSRFRQPRVNVSLPSIRGTFVLTWSLLHELTGR